MRDTEHCCQCQQPISAVNAVDQGTDLEICLPRSARYRVAFPGPLSRSLSASSEEVLSSVKRELRQRNGMQGWTCPSSPNEALSLLKSFLQNLIYRDVAVAGNQGVQQASQQPSLHRHTHTHTPLVICAVSQGPTGPGNGNFLESIPLVALRGFLDS